MNRRGQFLILAAILLCFVLLGSLMALRQPNPKIMPKYDYLQAAELIHVARLAVAKGSFLKSESEAHSYLAFLLDRLYEYNETYKLRMPPVSYSVGFDNGWYNVTYNATAGFHAYYSYIYTGNYTKQIGEVSLVYYRFELHYYHNCTGPWGYVLLYPELWDPLREADIEKIADGEWIVGVPAGEEYRLEDNFGISLWIYKP